MTETAATIVTAQGTGPATARDLSQRLDGIGYAKIRQTLHRLAKAGTVTKLRRGIYALGSGDSGCDTGEDDPHSSAPRPGGAARPARCHTMTGDEWKQALAEVWADFEAKNDPHDPRAWA